jgi:hypothetical protein
MKDLVICHGTFGRGQPWHQPGAPLLVALEAHGFVVHDFLWSGILAGVPTTLPGDPLEAKLGADDGELVPWLDAGEKLRLFCRLEGLEAPHLLSHSHGLQVGTFAAAKGQRFATWISISGPVRRDMLRARRAARGNVLRWVQVNDPTGKDRTILEGEAFDGEIGWHLTLPEADLNIQAPGRGHSGLTVDVAAWDALGLWEAVWP